MAPAVLYVLLISDYKMTLPNSLNKKILCVKFIAWLGLIFELLPFHLSGDNKLDIVQMSSKHMVNRYYIILKKTLSAMQYCCLEKSV